MLNFSAALTATFEGCTLRMDECAHCTLRDIKKGEYGLKSGQLSRNNLLEASLFKLELTPSNVYCNSSIID